MVKNIKYILISFFIFTLIHENSAQEISPSLLSTAGNNSILSGNSNAWAIGEIAVSTISNGNNTITQGLLQPSNIVNTINKTEFYLIKVFPNPCKNQLIIYHPKYQSPIYYLLSDVTGKIHISGKIEKNREQINISQLKPGMYSLTLYDNIKIHSTYKIIKVYESN
ncbi:MAG: hypothetical protein Kow0068_16290 [Marinilabiliales bacterium]